LNTKFLNAIKNLDEFCIGVYVKAYAEIVSMDKSKCPYYNSDLLAIAVNKEECGEGCLMELKDSELIQLEDIDGKTVMILGLVKNMEPEFFMEHDDMKEGVDFLNLMKIQCANLGISYLEPERDSKTAAMIKRVKNYPNWQKDLISILRNWETISKVLNYQCLTLNLLATKRLWDKSLTLTNRGRNLGNRYEEDTCESIIKPTLG